MFKHILFRRKGLAYEVIHSGVKTLHPNYAIIMLSMFYIYFI